MEKDGDMGMIFVDMQMPECCMDCRFNATGCAAMGRRFDHPLIYEGDDDGDDKLYEQRMPWCPLKELVTCKDCKYWSAERINDFNKCRRWIKVGVKNFATMGDWFCADGERKGGAELGCE